MKARLHGVLDQRAVAVIGVWDPLLPAHEQLFAKLRRYARRQSLAALVIAIDPDPVRYLKGPWDRPVYYDPATRFKLILGSGVDAVLGVRFTRGDVDATAAEFFAVVDRHARVAELWLGARQSLGLHERGDAAAIDRAAKRRRMRVRRLPNQRLGVQASTVRDSLRYGHLKAAARIVGRPPIRSRPRDGKLRLAWRPGRYEVLVSSTLELAPERPPLSLSLRGQERGLPIMDWPAAARYLAFVAGPYDRAKARR